MSITWFTHQDCKDMFLLSKWNQTKTYDYAIERDFGTDYGICCWYTPQLNFTEIDLHTHENHLHEPDWGHWFMNVPKVILLSVRQSLKLRFNVNRVQKLEKTTVFQCCLTLNPLIIPTSMRDRRD